MDASVFDVIRNDHIAVFPTDECQLTAQKCRLLCIDHPVQRIAVSAFDFIFGNVNGTLPFGAQVLFCRPRRITVARNLPHPRRKMCGNDTALQGGQNVKCRIVCQILGLHRISRLFQTEIKQRFHVMLCEVQNQLSADSSHLHTLLPLPNFLKTGFHPYSVVIWDLLTRFFQKYHIIFSKSCQWRIQAVFLYLHILFMGFASPMTSAKRKDYLYGSIYQPCDHFVG